jgi:hypothetical protein
MSRHGRKVPTSFFHRFTVDACSFADKYAQGRLVSVLEGGYSDRALISGAMAHLCGMVRTDRVDEKWWTVENLEKVTSILSSISPDNVLLNVPYHSWKKPPRSAVEGNNHFQPQDHLNPGSIVRSLYSRPWMQDQPSTRRKHPP